MSFYLKYRPQDFNNLVGQNFVKDTLRKAVSDDRLVGAYLLCGPRGTGKTSTARILAKTINCPDQKDGNPCLKCDICKDFLEERLIDIIEIDAASHTGVDNIREIIQKAQFSPTKTKYKVYIIDEVHMLSKGAFNALLKILEEPPSHVKFILATTETHKVPETIISRCQRFDFKKITNIDIENRLKFITESEKLEIDKNALDYIVKNSGGGLRNAISLLEQYIVDGKILYENIQKNLGLVGDEYINNFYKVLLEGDSLIVGKFDELIDTGINVKLFFKELFFYIKNDSVEKLTKGSNINNELFILSTIDDTFIKVKNSQDENSTFLIGLLKIVNFLNNGEVVEKKIVRKVVVQQTEKVEVQKPSVVETNISEEDIDDIFGDDTPIKQTPPPKVTSPQSSHTGEEVEQSLPQSSSKGDDFQFNDSNSDFNVPKYLDELRKVGAKGGLIFGIKGAYCKLNGNILNVKIKTAFALKAVNTSDNVALLIQGLENLGIESPEINFG